MIDKATAADLARAVISRMTVGRRHDLVLQEDRTIDTSFGWVFFYDSRRYLESGDFRLRAIGNSPLIVDRRNATVHLTGTAHPIEYYVKRYEAACAK